MIFRPVVTLLLGLLLSACVSTSGFYSTTPDLSLIRQATVRLDIETDFGENGVCSGVVIATDKVLTAAHCNAGNIKINGKTATVVKENKAIDIMEVRVDTGKIYPIAIADFIPSLDQELIAVGFPMYGLLFKQIVTVGRNMGFTENRMVMTVPIAPGNSGGPVFARNGGGDYKVVGIAVEIAGIGFSLIPHLSRAVDINNIKEFLK